MDLSTTYLGFRLKSPLMPGASPLVNDLSTVLALEDAGAAAIVLHSLFEEQISAEQLAVTRDLDGSADSSAEALTYFPAPDDYAVGPEEYLDLIRRIKEAVSIPVIASLNGTTPTGWLDHAKLIQSAGADALELNVYHIPTQTHENCATITGGLVRIVAAVRAQVTIPIAVKLSPYHCSLPALAGELAAAGASGLVLFNRFYQPDLDLEELDVRPSLKLSSPSELLLRLHALAILSGRVAPSLALTGGVHTGQDALKGVMAGAHAVQVVSTLLRNGPAHLKVIQDEMAHWLEEHEYDTLAQAQGSLSLSRCPDPEAYERGNYIHLLQSWRSQGERERRNHWILGSVPR